MLLGVTNADEQKQISQNKIWSLEINGHVKILMEYNVLKFGNCVYSRLF